MTHSTESARLLDIGLQERWWCPICGRVLRKPPYLQDGDRYHAWKCQTPMRPVLVTVTHIDGMSS